MARRRLQKRPLRALFADRGATSAVEFGIVAAPFVFMLMGVLQIAFYYFVQSALDTGVLKAGQTLYNGFRTGSSAYAPDAATLKATVVSRSGGLIANSSGLAVEIQPMSNLSSGSVPITDGVANCGSNTSTLVLRAKANVPAFTPFFGSLLSASSAVIVRRQGR